jgi:predicted RNA-binding Zn-ribbon protein involved in translation (DUF1610 family)
MPKLTCRCGYVHNLSPIPDAGWLTILDTEYEALTTAEIMASTDAATARAKGEPERTFVRVTGSLYECPECGRVLWRRPGDTEYRSFTLEDEDVVG